jgi:MFS family permease
MTKAFSDLPNASSLVKLVLSFPGLFIALSAILAGLIIDKFGRLKLLGIALVLYAIAGSSGYWLDNIYLILVGRALLGISVGISMTIVTTLVADYYQGKARQKFAGIQIAIMSLGGIIFITLGGFLADINWKVPFLLYLFSILILPFTYLYLEEPSKHLEVKAVSSSIKSPKIIWFVFINVMLMWVIFFIIPVQIPFYLKSMGVEKNALIGIAIASSTFFSAISAFSYSKIKDKLNFQQVFSLGYLLMAIGFIGIALSNSYAMALVGILITGLGMGFLIPNANIWVMQLAPLEIRGREIGRLTTFWFLGQFLSPIVLLPFLQIITLQVLFYVISGVLIALGLLFLILHLKLKSRD